MSRPRGALLLGSVPLPDAETVFRTASELLDGRLRRLPDGETNDGRDMWVVFPFPKFAENPALELLGPDMHQYGEAPRVQLRDGIDGDDLEFEPFGYVDNARASYEIFSRLKRECVIEADVRFQVSLPTPTANLIVYVMPEAQAAVEPALERRIAAEIAGIVDAIPHDELAIQWDVCQEVGIWEGFYEPWYSDPQAAIPARLARLADLVPSDVEMGMHFCYGDYKHQHFMQPKSLAVTVAMANSARTAVRRSIDWVHLPVPADRDDDAYFAPLSDLRLDDETEFYLGLVHHHDGVEGAQRRIDAAQRFRDRFGVATECGMGRRPSETIPDLLRIHAEVSEPIGPR
jgi:hypothetical protein